MADALLPDALLADALLADALFADALMADALVADALLADPFSVTSDVDFGKFSFSEGNLRSIPCLRLESSLGFLISWFVFKEGSSETNLSSSVGGVDSPRQTVTCVSTSVSASFSVTTPVSSSTEK